MAAIFSKTDRGHFRRGHWRAMRGLYQAWIQPVQAIVAVVILVVAAVALTVFSWRAFRVS
jgi:uncharacterized membrane protein